MKRFQELLDKFFKKHPQTRAELLHVLRHATASSVLPPDELRMLEGVLLVSQMQAEEIMIPRSEMIVFEKEAPLEQLLEIVLDAEHSRYPVIGDRRDEVLGIVLAKDLLKYKVSAAGEFQLRDILRHAVFVPKNKRLNVLLAEFRQNKNHMAIVVDEYGSVLGLITIEDILEQIVGDIADEHDVDADPLIREQEPQVYSVKAQTPLDYFNKNFSLELNSTDCDTIGGFVLKSLGYIPQRGAQLLLPSMTITVLHADARRIHLLQCTLNDNPDPLSVDS